MFTCKEHNETFSTLQELFRHLEEKHLDGKKIKDVEVPQPKPEEILEI